MSSWISGKCSKTCGGGIRNVTRHVLSGSGGQNCDFTLITEACNEHVCPQTIAVSSTGWICFFLILFSCFLAGVWLHKKGFVKKPELPLITFGEVAKSES